MRIRTYLLVLVFACLLPGIIGAGYMFVREYHEGRARLEKDTIQTARALVRTVDAYLMQAQAAVLTLAGNEALARGDLASFHRQASEVIHTLGLGSNFVLTDTDGQQLVNTLKPFGEPLPRHGDQTVLQQVIATGKPAISNVFIGRVLKQPVVSIDVPVLFEQRIKYVLRICILPEQFGRVLAGQGLPASWVAAIFDTTGTIVARTHAPERFVGKKGTQEFIDRIRTSGEGAMETVTLEGIPTFSIYSRSPATGWSIGIGIPRQQLTADLQSTFFRLALGGIGLFAIAFSLAWLIARRISAALSSLQSLATALGRGERVARPSLQMLEADDVAGALADSACRLDERTAALRLAESRFRRLCDANLIGVQIIDADGDILDANDYCLDLMGCGRDEFASGQLDWRWMTPAEWRAADVRATAELSATGVCAPYEKEYLRRDGSRRRVIVFLTALPGEEGAMLCVVLDVTDRFRAEQALARLNAELEQQVQQRTVELVQAQKLEAIGRLTGGVAHDFNNVLQALASSLFVLDQHVPPGTPRAVFDAAKQSIDSGARLTQAMLAFARRQTLVPEPVDLRVLFDGIAPLIERTLGGRIRVKFDVRSRTLPALSDRAQLESALLNLVINARDAMPSGGTLTVSAETLVVDAESTHPRELSAGEYVAIEVADSGCGMSEATLARAFEPFFTTKAFGSGSGLGLSMVQGMAAQSGGAVAIVSAPGKGTTVTLYLPCATPLPAASPVSAPAMCGDGSTVLLVDDNALMRNALEISLDAIGYRVIACEDGESALARLRRGEIIDVLVTDYAMPDMTGAELIGAARRLHPDLPVLLITGYAEGLTDVGDIAVLRKPFQTADLVTQLAALCRGEQGSASACAEATGL